MTSASRVIPRVSAVYVKVRDKYNVAMTELKFDLNLLTLVLVQNATTNSLFRTR